MTKILNIGGNVYRYLAIIGAARNTSFAIFRYQGAKRAGGNVRFIESYFSFRLRGLCVVHVD